MGIAPENKFTNISGVAPAATLIDATGVGTTDGSEYAAFQLNDGWIPFQQTIMDYAAGNQNSPSGSVGVYNGIADSAGVSQMLQALQLAHGIGPGKLVGWFLNSDPSVTGDRVLLLQGQGVLISTYPALDSVCYVGDGNNAAVAAGGGKFYRSSDSGGATPNIAGPYLQLPDLRGYVLRGLDTSGGVDPGGASRFIGDSQLDAFQGFFLELASTSGAYNELGGTGVNKSGVTFSVGGVVSRPTVQGENFVSDGVNGTPRIDSESRMVNISIKYGVTY